MRQRTNQLNPHLLKIMKNINTTTDGSATTADVINASNTFSYYYNCAERGWLSTEAITEQLNRCNKYGLTEQADSYRKLLADKSIADKYAANITQVGQRWTATEDYSEQTVIDIVNTVKSYTKRKATITTETYSPRRSTELLWTDKSITVDSGNVNRTFTLRNYDGGFKPSEYTITDHTTGKTIHVRNKRKGGDAEIAVRETVDGPLRTAWVYKYGRGENVNWLCTPTGWVSSDYSVPSTNSCALTNSLNSYWNGPMFR